MTKLIILAGGRGTRLQEETADKPKPMIEIGGQPLLWHIMNIFGTYGHEEFILALGYKANIIKHFFLNYQYLQNDLTLQLHCGVVETHRKKNSDWRIHLVDTGLDVATGGRLKRLTSFLDEGTFMMTYGDGVSNINIRNLLTFHRQHGKLATITVVHPPSRFGRVRLQDDTVIHFTDDAQTSLDWINGGFFVLEPKVLEYIDGDETFWEQEPLQRLIEIRQLVAYRHDGFWQCMDTLHDVQTLERLWAEGKAPWKTWK